MAMITRSELGPALGLRLREARMNAGLSEDGLGAKVYATERSIRGYENGIIIPNLTMVCNLAKVLKVPIGWLLAGEEAAQPKWISVKERLPEEVCRCLVITKRHEESSMVNTATYNHMGWWTHGNFGEITHWMPLPDPPEEGE